MEWFKKRTVLFIFLLIVPIYLSSIDFSNNLQVAPATLKNSFLEAGRKIIIAIPPEIGNLTDFVVVLYRNGQRIKGTYNYNKSKKRIEIDTQGVFISGDKGKLIVKKMFNRENYFHLEKVMELKFNVVSFSNDKEKSKDKKENKAKIKDTWVSKTPPEHNKDLSSSLVIARMQKILASPVKGESSGKDDVKDKTKIAEPDDVLDIKVWGHNDLSLKVMVDEEGKINYPLLGELKVAGLTPSKISRLLEAKLKDGYLKQAYVLVNLAKAKKEVYKIKVLGPVPKSGFLEFEEKPNLIDLLVAVGTPNSEKGSSWEGVELDLDIDGKRYHFRVDDLFANLEKSKKFYLADGTIAIFKIRDDNTKVYVLGNVAKPGKYNYYKGMTVLDALLEAGGSQAQRYQYASAQDYFRANLHKVMIVRKTGKKEVSVLVVNMYDAIYKGDVSKNIPLKAGDWVVVPQKRVKNIYTYISRLTPILNFITDADAAVKVFE